MKKFLGITLGILTAIGGFVDIGNLVANAATGARFRFGLAWVVFVGIVGIIVYAEMAGRVAALSNRPVFSLVRERLGPGSRHEGSQLRFEEQHGCRVHVEDFAYAGK